MPRTSSGLWVPETGLTGGQKVPERGAVPKARPVQPKELGHPEKGRADKVHPKPEEGKERRSGTESHGGTFRLAGKSTGKALPAKKTFQLYGPSGQPLTRPEGPQGTSCKTTGILGADGLPAERTPYVTAQDIQAYHERQKSRQKVPPYSRPTVLSPYNRVYARLHADQPSVGSELEALAATELMVMVLIAGGQRNDTGNGPTETYKIPPDAEADSEKVQGNIPEATCGQ